MRRINAHALEAGDVLVIGGECYDIIDYRELPPIPGFADGRLYVYVDVENSHASPFVFGMDEVITIL